MLPRATVTAEASAHERLHTDERSTFCAFLRLTAYSSAPLTQSCEVSDATFTGRTGEQSEGAASNIGAWMARSSPLLFAQNTSR